jgi:PLP dependent protein
VTKTVPVERLRGAQAAGLTRFAENRVQEAQDKAPLLPDVSWELVGRLQSNKVARAVELFDTIHSVDSLELAQRIARLAGAADRGPCRVYLQVNVDSDEAKSGFMAADVTAFAPQLAAIGGLSIVGLMTVGRLVADAEAARPTFRALRELSEHVRADVPAIGAGLSMGMSDDFEIAVEEGATVVRLGRVLFGERPPA